MLWILFLLFSKLLKVTSIIVLLDTKNDLKWAKQYEKLFFCPKVKKNLGRRQKPFAGAISSSVTN